MSLFFRTRRRETRADFVFPRPMMVAGGSSYADVDVSSMEGSLQSVAVRSTVDLISSLASELPVDVFTGSGDARRQIATPGYLEDPAGDGHGLADWLYQGLESWLLRGNLFGDVLDRVVFPGRSRCCTRIMCRAAWKRALSVGRSTGNLSRLSGCGTVGSTLCRVSSSACHRCRPTPPTSV